MYDFKNKALNIRKMNDYMLAKTLSMFEYENLPESLPYRELEKLLQVNGFAFITEVNGELYAFSGGLGGETDAYGNPTTITISNPHLKFNKTLDLKKDGVLIFNDDMGMGLIPLYEKHHFMMIENDINMVVYGYNTRTQKMISASDDKTRESAELYLKKSIDGDIAVIGENAIFEGVKVHSNNGGQGVSINHMVEFNQYLKASLYNEVGLSSNFNMKKERLITAEVNQSEDSLFPLVYNMMQCRLKAIELINTMFNTDIKIDFGSVWHFKNKELVDSVINAEKLDNVESQEIIEPTIEDDNGTGSQGTGADPEPEPEPVKIEVDNEDDDGKEETGIAGIAEKITDIIEDELNDIE